MSELLGDVWRERGLRDAALGGDAVAWRALYDGAYESVTRYVRWRCGGLADLADDVVQDAWMTAARKLASFEPKICPFSSWVCGIAANVLRHHLRSRTRYRRRVGSLGDADPPVGEVDREKAERVAAAFANLPERSERVLRAKYLDRMSVDAIAAAWGETPKAVESLLTRARQAFREEYEKQP